MSYMDDLKLDDAAWVFKYIDHMDAHSCRHLVRRLDFYMSDMTRLRNDPGGTAIHRAEWDELFSDEISNAGAALALLSSKGFMP